MTDAPEGHCFRRRHALRHSVILLAVSCTWSAAVAETRLAAREVFFSDGHADAALAGLVWGVKPDQPKAERSACLVALGSLSGPLTNLMKVMASTCSESVAACVPDLTNSIRSLGNATTDEHMRIQHSCPQQFTVLLTALRDPFLVVNMATLAVLHAAVITQDISMMLQALANTDYNLFGFWIGRVLDSILPLVRLPLSQQQMDLVMGGFVYSFAPHHKRNVSGHGKHDKHGKHGVISQGAAVARIGGHNFSHASARHLGNYMCTKATESQLAPANEALAQIAGSMLNITCYEEVAEFKIDCLNRAVGGLVAFASMLEAAVHGSKELRNSDCPPRLVSALRRLDHSSHLALDIITNSIEDFGVLEAHVFEAMDSFYDARLFLFGTQLGILFAKATEPAFYKYRSVNIPWAGRPAWERIFIMLLLPPMLFFFAALPLLCLFCSSLSGWPPGHQEISVSPSSLDSEGAEFDISHEFFGGRLPLGSEVDFLVEMDGDKLPDDVRLRTRTRAGSVASRKSFEIEHDPMLNPQPKSRRKTTGTEVGMRTGSRVVLTLTDELEPMSCARSAFWAFLGFMLPCFAGGTRRWKPQYFWRRGDDWLRTETEHETHDSYKELGVSTEDDSSGNTVDCEFYLEHDFVSPPVRDGPMETAFAIKGAKSAVMRIIPAEDTRECFDLLLLLSACVQLVASFWHLFWMFMPSSFALILEGEVLTLIYHWSRGATAALAIHKKMHAKWFSETHARKLIKKDSANCSGRLCAHIACGRTPTPVSFLANATAVKTSLRPLFPFAYTERHRLETGDSVSVTRWFHRRRGMVGEIVSSHEGARREHTVDFGDAQEVFLTHDLALADGVKKATLVPIWHDSMTRWILLTSMSIWIIAALCLTGFCEAMSDKDGFIMIRLQARPEQEPLSDWCLGSTILVQISCIVVELFIRFVMWFVISMITAICYA